MSRTNPTGKEVTSTGNEEAQYTSQAQLIAVNIKSNSGIDLPQIDNSMVLGFFHRESLLSPFISGILTVSDSADFLNGNDVKGNPSPIEGGEEIIVKVKTPTVEVAEEYKYRIWKIGNRISIDKKQAYALALVSEEALINETKRIVKKIPSGGQNDEEVPEMSITDIVKALIETDLGINSSKKVMSEPTKFKQVVQGARQRPFDIILKLSQKAISNKVITAKVATEQSDGTETKEVIKGTAGFFFWETKRGYNFFSVDAICDVKGGVFSAPDLEAETHGIYKEQIANIDGQDDRNKIRKLTFKSEIDVMSALRQGKYSSNIIFFNISTGQYEEYQYKITESYKNMAHLGNQNKVSSLTAGQKKLESEPSRLMTMVLDHETWYNGPDIADPEDKEAENPSVFADWHKHYAAQTVARKELLKNQQVEIIIPGNSEICAGDKVEIEVSRKAPDEVRKDNPVDEESSGVYLVKDVEHKFTFTDGTSGIVITTLQLFRDSFGMKDTETKRGE